MAPTKSGNMLVYEGCNYMRQRLILATLSGKSIKIKNIRHKEENPGLRDFEASLIRILDNLTNGSHIEVSETGTTLFYQPGLLNGGTLEHDCNLQRGIGYYLEVLMCLAPFTKKPIHAILRGVTNDQTDPSVDFIKSSSLPLMKRFLGTDEGLELKITRRGMPPGGGGEVVFKCPNIPKLRPVQFIDSSKIKRIRGVAYALRISPTTANRIVESAKGVLLKFLPDVYIYTDHRNGGQAGKSPGFGLNLVAETLEGAFLSAEVASNPAGSEKQLSVPEDLGIETAHRLLEEIYKGGCVDSVNQSLALLFMACGQQDISKIQIGTLTPYTIQFLRHMRDFLQVMFKIEKDSRIEDNEELRLGGEKIILTCMGIGYTNLNRIKL